MYKGAKTIYIFPPLRGNPNTGMWDINLDPYKPNHLYLEEELDVSKKTSRKKPKPSINKQLS